GQGVAHHHPGVVYRTGVSGGAAKRTAERAEVQQRGSVIKRSVGFTGSIGRAGDLAGGVDGEPLAEKAAKGPEIGNRPGIIEKGMRLGIACQVGEPGDLSRRIERAGLNYCPPQGWGEENSVSADALLTRRRLLCGQDEKTRNAVKSLS